MENYLDKTVFPSEEKTILVTEDADYGGAHKYHFIESLGFNNGKAEYDFGRIQSIQFVKKNSDGSIIKGIQSEQLLIALIDRHKKLNDKYPSKDGAKAIKKMEEALECLEARVKERIERDVMGRLEK
jgi:hypothetical protein